MNWNPDLASHIMECSNTAALQQHEASQDMSREEEAQQLADDSERIRVRANEIMLSDYFCSDVISDIPHNYIKAVVMCNMDDVDPVTCIAFGKHILQEIRSAAIRQARKELGL